MTEATITRRSFFRGAAPPKADAIRPPWVTRENLAACTGCADCVTACPEDILGMDDQNRPFVDFSDNGCTFCGDCASVCEAGVFGSTSDPAWQAEVLISRSCLLSSGVTCQICTDFCDAEALKFDLSQRPAGGLRVSQDACTGCGFCVGACPVGAIDIKHVAVTVSA